ncbi:MAG: Bug family tripartite tricarboxylate transporter substrate binding protein [Beijerinckiaceae bacterium]
MGIFTRALAAAAVVTGAAITAGAASAQTQWPTRAIKIITPQPPGTGIDVSCRVFGEKLSQRWGQPVVVENRPGADGAVGVGAFVTANDDHTLLCSFGGPITILPFTTQTKLTYDPAADLKPISTIVDFVQLFAVSATMGVDTLDAFVKKVRSEPGKHNWASTQGLPLLIMSSFIRGANLEMSYVPYTALTPALQDLGQGRIQLYATTYASFLPLIQSNQIRVLLTLNSDRARQLPNVPTAAEAGLPHLTVVSFNGFFGSRAMSDALRDKIAADIQTVGKDADVAAKLENLGIAIRTTSPAEFSKMIAEQSATVQGILKATGGLPGQQK